MPSFIEAADNIVAQLTEEGRALSARSAIEGVSFQFYGWAFGRGGYDPSNPVKILPIDPVLTALTDKIYPVSGLKLFNETDFEYPTLRTVSATLRVPRGTTASNYGIGELGIWVRVLSSPVSSEIGSEILFAVAHFPIKVITLNSAVVFRVLVNF